MKIFCLVYDSLAAAFALSFVCFRNVWFEMRVNIGMLIPLFGLAIFAALFVSLRKTRFSIRYKQLTALNLFVCFMVSLLVLGARSLGTAPASIMREALRMPHLRFSVVNAFIVGIFLGGFTFILLMRCEDDD